MYGASVHSKDWGFLIGTASNLKSAEEATDYAAKLCRGKAGGQTEGTVWRDGKEYKTLLKW